MNDLGGKDIYTLQIRRHVNTNNKSPQCEACRNGFLHVNSLQVRQFTQSGRLPGVCSFCNNAFLRICRLQIRHLTQTDIHPHVCEICNKTFTHAGNYRKHKQHHIQEAEKQQAMEGSGTDPNEAPVNQNTSSPPFICNLCKRSFLKFSVYEKHYNTHTKKSDFFCETCQICFDTKIMLDSHTHDDNAFSRCEFCNEAFIVASDLEQHLLSHKGESQQEGEVVVKTKEEIKTYICKECKKSFVQFAAFKNHCMVHKSGMPYSCKVCNKSFQYAGRLKSHQKVHANKLMPYYCKTCSKSFTALKIFQKHQKTHLKKSSKVKKNSAVKQTSTVKRGFIVKKNYNVKKISNVKKSSNVKKR